MRGIEPRLTLLALAVADDPGDECIDWPHRISTHGYPRIKFGTTQLGAHRVLCAIVHGPPARDDLVARHLCGRPSCVNPRHLAWGTRQDDADDRARHGTVPVGERSGTAKLTDEAVLGIRDLRDAGWSYSRLAALFDVGTTTIENVTRRRTWRHIA